MTRFLILACSAFLVAAACGKTEIPWPAGTKLEASPRMGPGDTYPIRLSWPVLEDARVLGYVVEMDGVEVAYVRENFTEVQGRGDHLFTLFAKGTGITSPLLSVSTTKPKRKAVGGGTGRFGIPTEKIQGQKTEVHTRVPAQKAMPVITKSETFAVTNVAVQGSISKKQGAEFVKGKSTHLRRCAKRYPSVPSSGVIHVTVSKGQVSSVSVKDVQDRGLSTCLKQALVKRFDFDKADKVLAKISYRIGG